MFKKIHVGALALAGAAVLSATPLGAQEITVTAWGGAYTKSQEEAVSYTHLTLPTKA